MSIENGLVPPSDTSSFDGWTDIACVLIQTSEEVDVEELWSATLPVPSVPIQGCSENGLVVRNWSALKDPHAEQGKSRVYFLLEAIQTSKHWRDGSLV